MLKLSIMNHGAPFVEEVRSLLAQFRQNTRIEVRLRVLDWRDAWTELVQAAIHTDGPDVSEIGNTWLSEFVNMTVLRAFLPAEIARLGGSQQFLPSVWRSGITPVASSSARQSWAVPWLADMRLIHYRQDLFDQAGVEARTAFESPQTLLKTCARLQAAGIAKPIALPLRRSRMTLHNVAGWVWGNGGEFISADGKQAQFVTDQAKAAIYAYFDLARFMPSKLSDLDENQSDRLFLSGQAAMTISGPWLQRSPDLANNVAEHVRQALLPGVPYLGGSQLVIWRHAPYAEPALKLIQHLSSVAAQTRLVQASGLLPTRLEVLTQEPFQDDSFYQRVAAGLKTGRTFPVLALWGMVENNLTEAFAAIWSDVFQDPAADIHAIVDAHLAQVAQRLNSTLAAE